MNVMASGLKNMSSRRMTALAIAGVFIVAGTLLAARSHAATYAVALEAENGGLTGNHIGGPTTGASAQKSVQFGGGQASPAPVTPPTPPVMPPTPETDRAYLTPATGTYTVGKQFTVEVRVNSGNVAVSAAQVDIGYSSNLRLDTVDVSQGVFTFGCPSKSGANGTLNIACIAPLEDGKPLAGVKGDNLVGKATFTVMAAGTGALNLKDSTSAASVADGSNVIKSLKGGSYVLK